MWRLDNTFLTNKQIMEEITKKIKVCIETNENENTTTQNLWDTIKVVLRESSQQYSIHQVTRKSK